MCIEEQNCGQGQNRRSFLVGATASAALASSRSLAQIASAPAPVTRVLDDPKVIKGPVQILHNGAPLLDGFLAQPKAEGRFKGVLVIAGNRITEEYIPNTCAALALAGFVGFAPNLYHVVPESAETNAQIAQASAKHDEEDVLLDMLAALNHLRRQPFVDPSGFGAVGFCFGGRVALKLGARCREVDAVVAFHPGPQLDSTELRRLRVPVQMHSGTADRAAPTEVVRKLARSLRAQGTPVDFHTYEGADHGFLAYTRPARYNPQAAMVAWPRATDFLKDHLKAT